MANDTEKLPEKAKRKGAKKNEDTSKGFSFSQISEFTGEVKSEFGKIAWPDKKHTVGSSVVVVILVVIMSLYLGAVDLFLGKLIGFILN